MSKRKLFVFAYDISDDAKRSGMSKTLEKEGVRVQGSVFEVRTTHEHASTLGQDLKRFLERGDSLRVYHVPDMALRFSQAHGGAPLPVPGDYLLF